MLKVQKLVAPIDFSTRSLQAAEYAAALARHFEAELTILHVIEPPRFEFAMMEPPKDLMQQMLAERHSKVGADLDEFLRNCLTGVNVRRQVMEGEPADVILAHCVEQHADLLVMPTRGRNPLRHFILGSVAAKVLHDARCPVLTGVHLERDFEFPKFHIRRVLCAVDLGPHSAAVLHWASEIAREFNAELTAMHVTAGEFRGRTAAENWNVQTSGVRKALEDLLSSASIAADVVIRAGEPHKEVSQAARGLSADLVVIGRGTEDGLLGRLRAHSYAIVREAPCPVLSI